MVGVPTGDEDGRLEGDGVVGLPLGCKTWAVPNQYEQILKNACRYEKSRFVGCTIQYEQHKQQGVSDQY